MNGLVLTTAAVRPGTAPPWQSDSIYRAPALGVLALHALVIWGLLHVTGVRDVVVEAVPLMVSLVSSPSPAPEPPQPTPLPRPDNPPPKLAPLPPPVFTLLPPQPQPQTITASAQLPAPPAEPAPEPPRAASGSLVAAAAPAAPTAPKAIATADMRYAKAPPLVYPPLSQRMREHGTTWLRLVVDAQGMPQEVRVERSSGYVRLDEAALTAMRQARFVPHMHDGRPTAWTAVAPLAFEL